MPVILIARPKCTLAALHAAPWWVTVSMLTGQTHRQTDGWIPDVYNMLSATCSQCQCCDLETKVSRLECTQVHFPQVSVLVSRSQRRSWQQHCCRKKLSSPRPITVSVGSCYYDCHCKANFTSDLLTQYSIVLDKSSSFCPDLCLMVENSVPRSWSRDLNPKVLAMVSSSQKGLDNNTGRSQHNKQRHRGLTWKSACPLPGWTSFSSSFHCTKASSSITSKLYKFMNIRSSNPTQRTHVPVAWLADYFPYEHKNRLYQVQGLGWRFSPARLRTANNTVTSWPHCLFVQWRPKMEKDREGAFKILC